MSFHNMDFVLKRVIDQPGWEIQKQYLKILALWPDLVSPKIAQNSRPSHLTQQILWIGVSSSAWSQHLSLQRYSLLKKLNSHLDLTLTDLRFSPALWYQNLSSKDENLQGKSLSSHPSKIQTDPEILTQLPKGETVLQAFDRWQKFLSLRSPQLTPCPQCKIATPQGEIDRWEMCCMCFIARNEPK
jgi:predicted nucleic acid-binding Zn ribbon protein